MKYWFEFIGHQKNIPLLSVVDPHHLDADSVFLCECRSGCGFRLPKWCGSMRILVHNCLYWPSPFKDDSLVDEFLEELALPHVGVAEVELQLVRHPLVQLLLPLTHLPILYKFICDASTLASRTCHWSTNWRGKDNMFPYWSQLDEMRMEQEQDKQHRLIALQSNMLGQTSGSIPLQWE